MKIRTLLITAASVIALSGTAMADDHLFNAMQHGLDPMHNQNSKGVANSDHRPGLRVGQEDQFTAAPGQGSPFSGGDTHTPASATIEDKHPDHAIKERCADPIPAKCNLELP